MHTYEFTLYLIGVDEVTLEMADKLFAAGCDDGSPGACEGKVEVNFMREANSLREAIDSAIANVRKAGYEVARVETDEAQTVASFNEQLQTAQRATPTPL